MIARIAKVALIAAAALAAGCTSTQIAQTTEQILLATGEDAEKARLGGQSAGRIVAATDDDMPIESERALGGGIALKSFSERGRLVADDALLRYVNLVGKSVARYAGRPEVPWAFAIVESDDVNAWAGPGGYIFITTGALSRMGDESQLAGVLAHEVAHVSKRHMVRMIKRSDLLRGVVDATFVSLDRDVGALDKTVTLGNDLLFVNGLDQSMEHESDAVGMEYAALAGYDPRGLREFLAGMQSGAAPAPKQGWAGGSTHPPLAERIRRIDAIIAQQYEGFGGATQTARFRRATGRS